MVPVAGTGTGDSQAILVCLEDRAPSIEEHLDIAERYKLKHLIFDRPSALGDYLAANRESNIPGFVLDMHDKRVKDLAEIHLPQVSTYQGEAVGLAVLEGLLREKGSPYQNTPVVLLTAFGFAPKIAYRVKLLRQRDKNLYVVRKGKGALPRFEKFIKLVVQRSEHASHKPNDRIDPDDYREGIDIAIRMLDELQFKDIDKALFFGFPIDGGASWKVLVKKIKEVKNFDIQDRVEFIIEIKSSLDAIFGLNPSSQVDWLSKPQDILDSRSPFALLRSGHQYSIARVLGMIKRVTG